MRRLISGLVLVLMTLFSSSCQQNDDSQDSGSAIDSKGHRLLNQAMMVEYLGFDDYTALHASLWPIQLPVENSSHQIDWGSATRTMTHKTLLNTIAHRPDISSDMLQLFNRYSGTVDFETSVLSEEEKIGRLLALQEVYIRIGSQDTSTDQFKEMMIKLATDLSGPKGEINLESNAVRASWFLSLRGVYQGVSLRADESPDVIDALDRLAGIMDISNRQLSEEERIARMFSLGPIYQETEKGNPLSEHLINLGIQLSGPPSDLTHDSSLVKAARLLSFSGVLKSADATIDSLTAMETLSGTIDYEKIPQSEAEQMARMFVMRSVLEQIGKYGESKEAIIASSLKLLGPTIPPEALSENVKAARLIALVGAYRVIYRTPKSKADILDAIDRLCGTIDYSIQVMSEKEKTARMLAMGEVYEAIGRLYPNSMEMLDLAIELFGPGYHPSTYSRDNRVARILAFSKLYDSYARQPDASADLLSAMGLLSGEIDYSMESMSHDEQVARMLSLGAAYQGMFRQPVLKHELKNLVIQLTGQVEAPAGFSDEIEAARLISLMDLYEGFARNPEALSDALPLVDELAGRIDYSL